MIVRPILLLIDPEGIINGDVKHGKWPNETVHHINDKLKEQHMYHYQMFKHETSPNFKGAVLFITRLNLNL